MSDNDNEEEIKTEYFYPGLKEKEEEDEESIVKKDRNNSLKLISFYQIFYNSYFLKYQVL